MKKSFLFTLGSKLIFSTALINGVFYSTLSKSIKSLFFPDFLCSKFFGVYLHIFFRGQIPQLGFADLQISRPSRIKFVWNE
jgi:hypothetical protein